MQERVKLFTHQVLNIEPDCLQPLEREINDWLASAEGRLTDVEHSQSTQPGMGQNIVVSVWYLPQG
jgi:hypothetical protein